MDIKEFLDRSAGKWFAQRTQYHLSEGKAENSKSEINVEMLSADCQELVSICQNNQIEPSVTLGGHKISWDNSVDWGKTKQKGTTIIVFLPDRDLLNAGRLLSTADNTEQQLIEGSYVFAADESLTLITKNPNTYSEERLWFASPNLRLRTTLIKNSDGFSATAFYSEIRRVG